MKKAGKGFVFAIFLFMIALGNVYANEVENGVIGEYDTLTEAESVAEESSYENETEVVETNITTESREYISDEVSLDRLFSSISSANFAAQIFRMAYLLRGYDVSDAVIEARVITEISTEEKIFNSIPEIYAYRSELENQGYDVDVRIVNFSVVTEDNDQTSVDETFTDMISLIRYLVSLRQSYNHLDVRYENSSYEVITDEDVSKIFSNREDANNYLLELSQNYEVTNEDIVYDDGQTENREPVEELFTSKDDANAYYDDLANNGNQLENKNLVELTASEIDMDEVLASDNITISQGDATFRRISGNYNSINVTFTDDEGNVQTSTGTLTISEIIVNGQSYRPNSYNINAANNSIVTIRGTIRTNYCMSYITIMGIQICYGYKTLDFESTGILNSDYNTNTNTNIFNRNLFGYNLNAVNFVTNSIDDNLIHIYKLNFDIVTYSYNPTYTVNAHIYKREVINQFRVYGNVSNRSYTPVYTAEYTKTLDYIRYSALVTAVKKDIKDVYIVNYTKTFKDPIVEENYVGDTWIEEETEVTNPNTADSIDYYIFLICASVLGLIATSYIKKRLQ